MEAYFFEIGLIIITACTLALIAYLIKQPIILAYILTGVVLGPSFFNLLDNKELIDGLALVGIAFLLFMVGLELDIKKLKTLGKVSLITGIGQIVFTGFFGTLIALALGFSLIPALYIAIALTFSSTIIIVKLLSEKHDTNSLYGKIAIGFLLVQDFVALLALIFLAGLTPNSDSTAVILDIIQVFVKAGVIFGIIAFLSNTVIPVIFRFIAKSQEFLFLASIAWCFLVAFGVTYLGLTIEIGAFLAGVSLASLPYTHDIIAKVKPLRDFFIIIFFVLLGTQMDISLGSNLVNILIFSVFVLIGNPFIVIILMALLGFKKRTSFLASITVAQISEFSLIVAAAGFKLGHIAQSDVSTIATVGIITITISTYMIIHGERLYGFIRKFIKIPEKKKSIHLESFIDEVNLPQKDHVVIVGHHVMGSRIAEKLKSMKKEVLVVDFDPEVISTLQCNNVSCLYGDVEDDEIFEKLHLKGASMLISTVPDLKTNLFLIKEAKKLNSKIIVMVATGQTHHAFDLYGAGADYVILPYVLGGDHSSVLIQKIDKNRSAIKSLKEEHLRELKKKSTFYSFF